MAIGFRAAGTVGNSTSDPATSPGMPAGLAAGDLMILLVSSKAATPPTLTTPSGWTAPSNNTTTGGAGAAGVDTGPNRITLCYREWQSGDAAPTIDLSAAGSPTQAVILAFTKSAGETWDAPICAVASDTSGSTTSYDPAASGTTIALASGDWLGVADAINGDAGTPTVPGTLTATGITFGTVVNRLNDGTNSGNDGRLIVDTAPYSSGTASAGPDRSVAYSGANASMAGCSVFWRLRVTASATKVILCMMQGLG
jgi:hypothetical protein